MSSAKRFASLTELKSHRHLPIASPLFGFFSDDKHPAVQRFVVGYQAKYHTMPGAYNARAYDAMIVAAMLMRQYGATREGVHDGLAKIKDIPSGVFGSITFDPATRRVKNPSQIELLVKGDAFTLWDGTPARAA